MDDNNVQNQNLVDDQMAQDIAGAMPGATVQPAPDQGDEPVIPMPSLSPAGGALPDEPALAGSAEPAFDPVPPAPHVAPAADPNLQQPAMDPAPVSPQPDAADPAPVTDPIAAMHEAAQADTPPLVSAVSDDPLGLNAGSDTSDRMASDTPADPVPALPSHDSHAEPVPASSHTAKPAHTPIDVEKGSGDDNELLDVKQHALQELTPLVSHLDLDAEHQFETYMMIIRASDDKTLIKPAYEVAQKIADEDKRAQALLDVVNEVNYLTQDKKEKN